jgi:hypothetical protein
MHYLSPVYFVNQPTHFFFLYFADRASQYIYLIRLPPNDPYMGRTAPLTSKSCILYIYSTNIGTEYFKHAPYSPFFPLQNAVCFIMLNCVVPVLFTFYIQDVLKLKEIIPAPKGNINQLDALNFIRSLCHASTCFEHTCLSSGGQNCTIQTLVISNL